MTETPRTSEGPVAPPAAPPPSKGARIWKRTLFGSGLALACAAILWSAHALGSALPILCIGSLVSLLGLIEVSLMGTLLIRALPVILVVPLFGVALIEYVCLKRPPESRPWVQLVLEVVFAASLAVLIHAVTRGLARRVLLRQLLIFVVVLVLTGAFGWLASQGKRPLDALTAFGAFAGVALVLALVFHRSAGRRKDLLIAVGLALWIGVPLPATAQIARLWGIGGLVSLVILSKIGDVAGYYVGNAIGRSHPFPRLSPGKTTAGCVASFVAGVAGGVALAALDLLPAGRMGLAGGLLAGACINLAAQAGDLFESWVKRRARVKDSSTWLGPSGGVLDVVDSLLFSVPLALLVWPLLFRP